MSIHALRTVLLLAILLAASLSFAQSNQQYGILFITSVDPDQPGIESLIGEARTAIQDSVERPTHFDVEYLDPQLSDGTANHDRKAAEFFRSKYSRQRFALIIAIGPGALRFAEKYGAQISPGALILSVVFQPSPEAERPSAAGITTIYIVPNLVPTLNAALAQNPGTQQVVLVAGSAPEDKLQLRQAKEELEIYAPKLKFVQLTDNTLDELKLKLSRLDPDSVVLFLDFTADSRGEEFISTQILPQLSRAANRPMYGAFHEFVGSGVIGGSVLDMREVGRATGRTAARVLKGEKPEDLLFSGLRQQRYVFDARELKRWRIFTIPAGSILLNQEDSSWRLYKWRFIGLALAVTLEALLIILLLWIHLKRRKAERELARLLAVERLQNSLAGSLIYLPAGLVRGEIDHGFRQFIEFFAIDCISLFEFDPESSQFRLLRYQAMRGTPLRLSRLKPAEFKWTMDKLLLGQTVVVRTRSDVPEEASSVIEALRKSGVNSFAGLPLTVDKRVVGALFFSSSKERDWDPTLLEELSLISAIVGSGLERARSHSALAESEQLKSAILASLPKSVAVLDNQGRVIAVNSRPAMFPYKGSFAQGSLALGVDYLRFCRRAAEEGSQYARDALAGLRSVLSRTSSHFEMEYPSGDPPHQQWCQMSVVPLSSLSGGVVISHTDITEQKNAELVRREAEAARAEIGGKLLQAQEEERTRIARELHDDINQKLGLLAIDIQQLQQHMPESNQEAQRELGELFEKTNRISSDVQRLSHQLHSSRLDYLGLPAALRRLCEEFGAQHNIFAECLIGDVPAKLSRDIGLCLFRVAQECLTNAAKHGSATHVRVYLHRSGGAIRMEVSDNGNGFDPAKVSGRQEPGLGLISMRERLRLVNGELLIQSREGEQTRVTAIVPLHESTEFRQASGFAGAKSAD